MRILLVDDDPDVRALTQELLEAAGHEVKAAPGPEEALGLVTNGQFEPEAVVTDLMMPGETGIDLLAQLRERAPRLPAVVISGYPAQVLARHGAHRPDLIALAKPFTPMALSAAITKAFLRGARSQLAQMA
jgi:CheY-like chemotaxis protein